MAQRRMFSKRVTESGRFLLLSHEAQLVYFHMGMIADDDGFADCFFIIRALEVSDETIAELIEKGFIEEVNVPFCDCIYHISHWSENNQVRKDRYTPSMYADYIQQSAL